MKSFSLTITCCIFSWIAAAQDSLRHKLLDIDLQYGVLFNYGARFSDEEWNKLTPGYQNIDETDTTYNHINNGFYAIRSTYMQVQVLGEFNWQGFNRRGITTLTGFSFGTGSMLYAGRFSEKSTRFRADTLTSNATGTEYYIDSVVTINQLKAFSTEFIDLGISLMFETDRAKRFSVMTGVTLLAGIQYRGNLVVQDGVERSAEDTYTASPNTYPNRADVEYTYANPFEKDAPASFQLGVKIPVEVGLTIGKKPGFWSKCVVGVNLSPGYRYTMIEGIDGQNIWNLTGALTLKYRIFG